MIAGIEGLHSWTPAGEDDPVIVLGDPDADVYLKLTRISGLKSLADPQDNRDNKVGAPGEIARKSLRRGKTVVYEGIIKAPTLRKLRQAEADLGDAFAALEEGRMEVAWHPDNEDFDDLTPRYFTARSLTCDVVDVQENKRWHRGFVIGLRMSDPRYFETDTGSHSVTVTNTNTSYTI